MAGVSAGASAPRALTCDGVTEGGVVHPCSDRRSAASQVITRSLSAAYWRAGSVVCRPARSLAARRPALSSGPAQHTYHSTRQSDQSQTEEPLCQQTPNTSDPFCQHCILSRWLHHRPEQKPHHTPPVEGHLNCAPRVGGIPGAAETQRGSAVNRPTAPRPPPQPIPARWITSTRRGKAAA